jgi:hypothetical protein
VLLNGLQPRIFLKNDGGEKGAMRKTECPKRLHKGRNTDGLQARARKGLFFHLPKPRSSLEGDLGEGFAIVETPSAKHFYARGDNKEPQTAKGVTGPPNVGGWHQKKNNALFRGSRGCDNLSFKSSYTPAEKRDTRAFLWKIPHRLSVGQGTQYSEGKREKRV